MYDMITYNYLQILRHINNNKFCAISNNKMTSSEIFPVSNRTLAAVSRVDRT